MKGIGTKLDFSPQARERSITQEATTRYAQPKARTVVNLKAVNQTSAIFAAVIGVNGAENGISVQADDKQIVITGDPGGTITLDWKPNANPRPVIDK